MRPHEILTVLALILGAGCYNRVEGVSSQGGRPQKVLRVPEPPSARPWTPPATTVSKEIVDRTAFLLQHGMGDPRGGQYRSAMVYVGSLWGQDDKPSEIHGWVLPKKGDGPAWIVAPTGLIYRVESVGDPVDLDKDIARLNQPNPLQLRPLGQAPVTNFAPPETIGLLLVAGRKDLAERLQPAQTMVGRGDFLSQWFDQAVTAHMRGDDETAARVAWAIRRERPFFEQEALSRRGQQYATSPGGQPYKTDEQFPYLDVLPALIEDTERRLDEKPKPSLDLAGVSKQPIDERIKTLIGYLDEVKARQWGQPGGVNLADDPIVRQLIEVGTPAGEALIDVMEHDERLTRSVSFGRDFFPNRNLIRVKDAAYAALRGILQVDQLPMGSDGRPSIEAIRKFFAENKGKSPTDLWFDTLADDHAGWRRWTEAVDRLFDPVGAQRNGFWIRDGKPGGPIKAEALRSRTNPSLSDLLDKRAREITFQNDEQLPPRMMLMTTLPIAVRLQRWDAPRSLPLLKDLTKAALTEMSSGHTDDEQMLTQVVPALIARHDAGDLTAWADYTAILSKVERTPFFDSKYLRPIVEHPKDPGLKAARKLLTTPGSKFDAVDRLIAEPPQAGIDNILVSPALKLPEVWSAALKALSDKRVIGTAWVDERGNGWMEAKGKAGPAQGTRPDPKDPLPKAGEKRPLRAADVIAHAMARMRGAPKFQPFWPPAQKDAAIAKLRAFLMANHDRIDAIVGWPNNWLDPETDRKLREG